MPILRVELVTTEPEKIYEQESKSIADVAGEIFDVPDGHIWSRLIAIDSRHYSENGKGLGNSDLPVFVTVMMKQRVPNQEDLEVLSVALTEGIARVVGREKKYVHLFYQQGVAGEVAFGGRLQYS